MIYFTPVGIPSQSWCGKYRVFFFLSRTAPACSSISATNGEQKSVNFFLDHSVYFIRNLHTDNDILFTATYTSYHNQLGHDVVMIPAQQI
jgi:acyl-CoA thioesterase